MASRYILGLPVFGRGDAQNLPELPEEMHLAPVAAKLRDLGDGHIGGLEGEFRMGDPHSDQVLLEGDPEK